jgi:serine/threonine protein kinase
MHRVWCDVMVTQVLLGSYGAACDMWSMGVISYMMLSGAPPFWGSSDTQVHVAHCY